MEINLNINSKIKKTENNSHVYNDIISKRKTDNNKNVSAPLISVIIPCYNSETFIDRCLGSVAKQTIGIENLQIIIINDASTDNTLQKMREWENKFPENILIVSYDENLRQGGARNIGLCYADAEYVGFIDSDDWIEPDMYEILYKMTYKKKWDTVKCKFIRDTRINNFYKDSDENSANAEDITVICYEFEELNGFYKGAVAETGKRGQYGIFCCGIYLKKLILKNNIWFPEKLAYEDNYWLNIINLYIKNICIADKILYHWYYNPNSTVSSKNKAYHLDKLTIELILLEEYKKRGAFNIFHAEIEHEFIQRFYLEPLFDIFIKFNYMPDIINYMKKKIAQYFPNFKKELNLSLYDELNQQLLRLLYIEENISVEMMINVKNAYLEIIENNFDNDKPKTDIGIVKIY